ncbi:HLA class II histocompatibility antigen, DM beta chain isoform X1 [Rhinatrema bivittatum]|uniref:HLA class II histocompatibility antigen, DM beta chain isoform X1 n=1 Tax=Rhinatrema bivittatum TaxID=194408 RepID=UPI00112AB0B8|nr:HLA class II histocompatibility antigen, DM beta chain isoform X1 [Rhinatrema bivittatum]
MQGPGRLALLLGWALIHSPACAFVTQLNRDCIFGTSTETMLHQYYLVFNRQVFLWYDSRANLFIPCSLMYQCIPPVHTVAVNITTFLNQRPDFLSRIQQQEKQCRDSGMKYWGETVQRTVPPTVRISPLESGSGTDARVLVCYVFGFFPGAVNVTWLKNGHPVASNATAPEVLPDGDWSYQTQARLEVTPQSGDSYTCSVEHASHRTPFQEDWRPGLTKRQKIKIGVSVAVLALGIIFLVTGVICWRKSHSGYVPIPGYSYPEVS